MVEPREAVERLDKLAPRAALVGESAPARARQAIEPFPPLTGLFDPLAFYQALALQAVQHRVQRGDVKLQLAVRSGFDQLRQFVAVARAFFEKRENDYLSNIS